MTRPGLDRRATARRRRACRRTSSRGRRRRRQALPRARSRTAAARRRGAGPRTTRSGVLYLRLSGRIRTQWCCENRAGCAADAHRRWRHAMRQARRRRADARAGGGPSSRTGRPPPRARPSALRPHPCRGPPPPRPPGRRRARRGREPRVYGDPRPRPARQGLRAHRPRPRHLHPGLRRPRRQRLRFLSETGGDRGRRRVRPPPDRRAREPLPAALGAAGARATAPRSSPGADRRRLRCVGPRGAASATSSASTTARSPTSPQEFPQLCEAETEVFARLLGRHVQRLATIAHGDGVCTTNVPRTTTSRDADQAAADRPAPIVGEDHP